MLVLTREIGKNQTIKIGDEISVSVLSVNGNQVKVGIDAPRDVAVHREEVFAQIKAKKD